MDSALKLLTVALALAFSAAILLLVRHCFDGWASRRQIGRSLGLSLLSILLTFPIAIAMTGLAVTKGFDVKSPLYAAFGLAAFPEETARLIALLVLIRGTMTKDPREFAVGVAAIGLGFGMIENLMYISGAKQYFVTGAVRGILSAPAHLAFAFVTGTGLWAWRRGGAPIYVALGGYVLAMLLHGSFNFTLMSYPDAEKWAAGSTFDLRIFGVAAFMVMVMCANTVLTVLALSQFIAWCEDFPPHDPSMRTLHSDVWEHAGTALLAVIGVIGMGLVFLFVRDPSKAWGMLPVLVGAAVSLGIWSVGIPQVARLAVDLSMRSGYVSRTSLSRAA